MIKVYAFSDVFHLRCNRIHFDHKIQTRRTLRFHFILLIKYFGGKLFLRASLLISNNRNRNRSIPNQFNSSFPSFARTKLWEEQTSQIKRITTLKWLSWKQRALIYEQRRYAITHTHTHVATVNNYNFSPPSPFLPAMKRRLNDIYDNGGDTKKRKRAIHQRPGRTIERDFGGNTKSSLMNFNRDLGGKLRSVWKRGSPFEKWKFTDFLPAFLSLPPLFSFLFSFFFFFFIWDQISYRGATVITNLLSVILVTNPSSSLDLRWVFNW